MNKKCVHIVMLTMCSRHSLGNKSELLLLSLRSGINNILLPFLLPLEAKQ